MLLKAVVQAVPTYAMSVFILSKRLRIELASLMAKSWWGHMQDNKNINWRSWVKMSAAKRMGGLGFKDLECFNKAMLAEQCWRLIENSTSLLAIIMKEKYFRGIGCLEAKVGVGSSFIWKSLCSSIDLIKEGMWWRVGDGSEVNI